MILHFVKHTHTFPRPNLKTTFSTLTILYYKIDIIYFTLWLSLIITNTLRADIYQIKLYTSTGTTLYPVQYKRSCDVYFWYCASVIYMYVMTPVLIYCCFTVTFLRLRLIKMRKVSILHSISFCLKIHHVQKTIQEMYVGNYNSVFYVHFLPFVY